MVSVNWSREALQHLDDVDPLIRERIVVKVGWLQNNLQAIVPEPLHRDLKGLYKLRIGHYRVVYAVRGGSVFIEMVGHRRDVYR